MLGDDEFDEPEDEKLPGNVQAVIKVAKLSSDNDLIGHEAEILRYLYPEGAREEKFYRYLPKLHASTKIRGRAANVLSYAEGFITLADTLKACPDGIDYRDLAWMLKRSLVAIGYAHERGVVHGAVVPTHILVHPTGHGAKLIDWSYAEAGGKNSIKAYVGEYKDYYPPEVFKRQLPGAEVDTYMLAKCCVALLGGDVKTNKLPDTVPEKVRDFFRPLLLESPGARRLRGGAAAWDLHDRFDWILKELVGKPKYRPFRHCPPAR